MKSKLFQWLALNVDRIVMFLFGSLYMWLGGAPLYAHITTGMWMWPSEIRWNVTLIFLGLTVSGVAAVKRFDK